MSTFELDRRRYLELEKLALGAFAPVTGFMTEEEFHSIVDTLRLPGGAPFPLPIVLDVPASLGAREGDTLALSFGGERVGEVDITSVYRVNRGPAAETIFGTADLAHPGVAHFHGLDEVFVGGSVRLERRAQLEFSDYDLTPTETRELFGQRGWRTVAGFQTRNIPHRAHEYLQRLALEQTDGLFIQPLVGFKKRGDFNPLAILAGYRTLIGQFFPSGRVHLGVLSTAMRYAGPREAVFHAIVRRNYGCTHFIVGRDHAGVGDYYGKYEAHDLTAQFDGELGIEILRFAGPFWCELCDAIVTERTCPHPVTQPDAVEEISGSRVRAALESGAETQSHVIRPEIVASVAHISRFIAEEDE